VSKGQKQPSSSAPPSRETRSKSSFDLRYTLDAAADIKALDGSVRNQPRKVLEKKLSPSQERAVSLNKLAAVVSNLLSAKK
jgi:hypothetical protein